MSQKKKYVKPDLEFVNFVMSSSIAGTCKYEANSAEGSCLAVDNGWTVYNTTFKCDYPVDSEEVCYHVPTADTSIFAS